MAASSFSRQIILRDYQKPHAEKIIKSLMTNISYVDISVKGAGKTIFAMYTAQYFKARMFIIAPSDILVQKWRDLAGQYGITAEVYTYASLHGTSDKLNHPYLTRKTYGSGTSAVTNFQVTEKLDEHIAKGTLFIFDEFHHVKNIKTKGFECVSAISERINTWRDNHSRIGYLSNTPLTDKEQMWAFCILNGLVSKWNPSSMQFLAFKGVALDMIKKKAMQKDEKLATQISTIHAGANTTRGLDNCLSDLVVQILARDIVFSCIVPDKLINEKTGEELATKKYYNVFCTPADEIEKKKMELAMKNLIDTSNSKDDGVALDVQALTALEFDKVGSIVRQTLQILKENPKAKVVIAVNYVIGVMAKFFEEFNTKKTAGALFIHGGIVGTERLKVLSEWDKNSIYQVLVAQINVIQEGIDLDDVTGEHPRFLIVSPSFKVISMNQALGRCYRPGRTTGVVTVYVWYSFDDREKRMLENAKNREDVMSVFRSADDKGFDRSCDFESKFVTI